MFNRTNYLVGIFSLAIVMAVTTPILTNAEKVGEDWYCSDHEAHRPDKHCRTTGKASLPIQSDPWPGILRTAPAVGVDGHDWKIVGHGLRR